MSTEEHPKLKVRLSGIDYLLEISTLLVVIAGCFGFVIYWQMAPQTVFIHYELNGLANRLGSKLWQFPLITCLTTTYAGMLILHKYPHIFKFPIKITEENACHVYKVAIRMIRIVNFILCSLFSCLIYFQLYTLQNPLAGLEYNVPFMSVMCVLMLLLLITFIIGIMKIMKY